MGRDAMTSTPLKSYVAGGPAFLYPKAGDPKPPGGAKVLLLTKGGVCIVGPWTEDGAVTGWSPLPVRDKEKEKSL